MRKAYMKINGHTLFLAVIIACLNFSYAQYRSVIPFNTNWKFSGQSVSGRVINDTLDIPHTWNAYDAQQGIDYFRGEGIYENTLVADPIWQYRRVFLYFEGVMSSAEVYVNNQLMGEHRGGYSAFCYEITDVINLGTENSIRVIANNSPVDDILPLVGDFNLYGGMYRPVKVIVTDRVCISPLDYASDGVYLKQESLNGDSAEVSIISNISQGFPYAVPIGLRTTIFDQDRSIVATGVLPVVLNQGDTTLTQKLTIPSPRLWQGKKDPYLYTVRVDIYRDLRLVDRKETPLGLRTIRIDPNEGFFLNDEHIVLKGVSRHQDRKDQGSALTIEDHRQDMDIMLEMGVNAVRLAHYQQAKAMYSLCDSSGVIVWAEIPWIGFPDFLGEGSNGYNPTDPFHQNARQQLTELIRQNYNHPSICFWGVFNEIQNPKEASPVAFVRELDSLAKVEDPSRITVGASMLEAEEPIHDITDAIAWNKYFGWYYYQPEKIGEWLDETHAAYPNLSIGVSEYGAGGSIHQHSQVLSRPNPFGSPHPEEWQSYYHEKHWQAFEQRPYVWGTFVWNMFDFSSHFRREGDQYGMNDKGLVTYDRKVKKDAFYYYKANWTDDPVIYITSRRHIFRQDPETSVKVYTNLPTVSLTVNGQLAGEKSSVGGIATWNEITLEKGNNTLEVKGSKNGIQYQDHVVWILEDAFSFTSLFSYIKFVIPAIIASTVLLMFIARGAFRRQKGYDRRRRNSWKRGLFKIMFFLILFVVLALVGVQIFLMRTGLGA